LADEAWAAFVLVLMLIFGISLVRWPHRYQNIAQRYSRVGSRVPFGDSYINSRCYLILCQIIGWFTIALAMLIVLGALAGAFETG
jgi:hypothetical protein